MKILNDSGMSFGWLVGRVPPHKLCSTFVVKGTFELRPGSSAVLTDEPDVLQGDIPEEDSPNAILYGGDLAPIKLSVDVLVSGRAWAPRGETVATLPVKVSLGNWEKSLVVIGDRRMPVGLSEVWTEPEPFESMPLRYSRSFGGPDFPLNPAGKGHALEIDGNGKAYFALPNILHPDEVHKPIKDLTEPAAFGPIAPYLMPRMKIARKATFNKSWLKDTWPGYPRDFDWSYFNTAPIDQRFDLNSIRGDELLLLENLHPVHRVFQTALPGVRPRWFLKEEIAGVNRFREIILTLDTVWIEPDQEKLILLWRGIHTIESKSMREVQEIFLFHEPLNSPVLSLQEYEAFLERRKKEIEEVEAEEVLPPLDFAPIEPELPSFDFDAFEKNMVEENEKAKAMMMKESMPGESRSPMDLAAEFLRSEGASTHVLEKTPVQDPVFLAKQIKQEYDELAKTDLGLAKLLGPPPTAEDLDPKKAEEEFDKEFGASLEGEQVLSKEDEDEDENYWTRDLVIAQARDEKSFDNEDLSELDLSGLDLSGCSFRETLLDKTNLSGATLASADLTGAVLTDVDLSDATLTEANLESADLTGAKLDRADLTGTRLYWSEFSRASLVEAKLSGVDASKVCLTEVNLTDADLKDACLVYADFTGARFPRADFTRASLQNAGFYNVIAPEAKFDHCDLTGFRAGEKADLTGCSFVEIQGSGSVWDETVLDNTSFTNARLTEANFGHASLIAASFLKADLKRAKFFEANLTKADLVQADLFRASLEGCILFGVDLRGSNLYEVEFLDAIADDEAKFEFANLKGTKLA